MKLIYNILDMRFRALLSIIPIFCVFTLCSCNNNNDPYKNNIVKDSDEITHTGSIQTEYTSGSKIKVSDDFTVSFKGQIINALGDNQLTENLYFFTASNESPTVSIIRPNSALNTGKRKYSTNIYLAVLDSNKQVYVTKPIAITITNSNVINPVLYYVGGGIIIVAVAAIIYFAKKYKETH